MPPYYICSLIELTRKIFPPFNLEKFLESNEHKRPGVKCETPGHGYTSRKNNSKGSHENMTSCSSKTFQEVKEMENITNYNCDGLCAEATCSKRYTQMERINLNGIEMILAMCDEHAQQWENYSYKHSGKLGKIFPANKHKVMLHDFV